MGNSHRHSLDFSRVDVGKTRPAPVARIAFVALAALLVLTQVGTAEADRFDSAAKGAKELQGKNALGALFWSQNVNCAKAKGDFRQRQCRGVRDTRLAKVLGQSYLVDVGSEAVDIEIKPATVSARVTLRACVACGEEGPIIVGLGSHRVAAKKISAASLASETKVFKKLTHVQHWEKYIGSRLRAQFIVKVSSNAERFKAAGRQGFKVNVVGYRLYDPCQGDVVVAKPASKKGPVNDAACKDVPAMESDTPKGPKVPVIVRPDRLNTQQIKTAMKDVKASAKKCHEAYGIDGMATFKLVIAGSGQLKKAKQTGDFEGTPTGICLDKAMKLAVFPKSKKKATPITYPMMLR
jgi:hypothetical protein